MYGRLVDVWLSIGAGVLALGLPLLQVGAPQYPPPGLRGSTLLVTLLVIVGLLVHRLIVSGDDKTATAEANTAQFRAVFDDASVGLAMSGPAVNDNSSGFVRANRALCAMLGYSEQDLPTRPVSEFVHSDDTPLLSSLTGAAITPSAGSPERRELRLLRSSGLVMWAAVSCSLVHAGHARPRVVRHIEDVTIRRQTDQALLHALDTARAVAQRLRDTDQTRQQLLSSIAHDLRAQFTAALGYNELL